MGGVVGGWDFNCTNCQGAFHGQPKTCCGGTRCNGCQETHEKTHRR